MSLVCWSGGCDSTLVLYNLVKNRRCDEIVRAVSITHPQIYAAKESKTARANISKFLHAKGYGFLHSEIEVSNKGHVPVIKGNGIAQGALWLSMSSLHLEEKEDLYFGYIREDDIWHYRNWFFCAFFDLKTMMGKEGAVKIPLEWHTKTEVLKELPKDLLKLCWWCESPKKGKACGKCKPCVRHKKAVADL